MLRIVLCYGSYVAFVLLATVALAGVLDALFSVDSRYVAAGVLAALFYAAGRLLEGAKRD